MGARSYLPTIGRFLQTDPVDGGSANPYDYVDQDPINRLDLAGTNDGEVTMGPAAGGGQIRLGPSEGGRPNYTPRSAPVKVKATRGRPAPRVPPKVQTGDPRQARLQAAHQVQKTAHARTSHPNVTATPIGRVNIVATVVRIFVGGAGHH
jgi:hypothetical protein